MGEKVPNNKGFLWGRLWTFFHFIYIGGLYAPLNIVKQMFSPHRRIKEIPRRSGEVAIITGGARGIGAEVAKQFLEADMTVIIGCRDVSKGDQMVKEFRQKNEIIWGKAHCIHLDLNSFQSVKQFVKRFMDMDLPLHILVNNAGIVCPFTKTVDGFESSFQVNYLSHFLLTALLLPALSKGGNGERCSRIINVSSVIQELGHIDFDDLPNCKFYDRYSSLANTKLMQIAHSNYLNKRFLVERLPIRAYSIHPGLVGTDLFRKAHLAPILKLALKTLGKNPKKGSDTIVWTAFSDELDTHGGKFIANCSFKDPDPQADDPSVQIRLWDLSCKLTKLEGKNIIGSIVSDPYVLVDIVEDVDG